MPTGEVLAYELVAGAADVAAMTLAEKLEQVFTKATQFVRSGTYPGAALGIAASARSRAASDELGHAIGPERGAGSRTIPDRPARLSRLRRLIPSIDQVAEDRGGLVISRGSRFVDGDEGEPKVPAGISLLLQDP